MSFIEAKQQEEYLTFEDLEEYVKSGINTFIFSGIGVYNIAMYMNYIRYIYTDEYKFDAINNFLSRLVILKEQEAKEIHDYRI